jgi:hypothetical protein
MKVVGLLTSNLLTADTERLHAERESCVMYWERTLRFRVVLGSIVSPEPSFPFILHGCPKFLHSCVGIVANIIRPQPLPCASTLVHYAELSQFQFLVELLTALLSEQHSQSYVALPPLSLSAVVTGSWNSTVGIATDYGLDGRGVRVRVPVGSRICLVRRGSAAHPASYPMDTGISFPGGKAAGA